MKSPVSTAYDDAQEYDKKRFTTPQGKLFHTLELEQLQSVVSRIPTSSRVLEVGSGSGRFVEYLAKNGYRVRGVEPSQQMIEIACQKVIQFPNAGFDLGEGAALPYNDSEFDLVFSIRVINQTESKEYALRMIHEMIRVTKPGGYVLVEFVNSWGPRNIIRNYTISNQTTLLSIRDMKNLLTDQEDVSLLHVRGVLLFSQTILNYIPAKLVYWWGKLEHLTARLFPQFASRCYIILHKNV